MTAIRLEDSCRYKIAEQFAADGIRYVFGNPGTVEEGFLDALSSFPDLTYVLALQEGVANRIRDDSARSNRRVPGRPASQQRGSANGTVCSTRRSVDTPPLVVASELESPSTPWRARTTRTSSTSFDPS
jgi:benzoylformate decarboxylase